SLPGAVASDGRRDLLLERARSRHVLPRPASEGRRHNMSSRLRPLLSAARVLALVLPCSACAVLLDFQDATDRVLPSDTDSSVVSSEAEGKPESDAHAATEDGATEAAAD